MTSTAAIKEKVVETVLAYWRLAEQHPPSAQDLATWFDAQEPAIQRQLLAMGLSQVLQLTVFTRYCLEKHGFSMENYMRIYLMREEFPHWVDDHDGGVRPD